MKILYSIVWSWDTVQLKMLIIIKIPIHPYPLHTQHHSYPLVTWKEAADISFSVLLKDNPTGAVSERTIDRERVAWGDGREDELVLCGYVAELLLLRNVAMEVLLGTTDLKLIVMYTSQTCCVCQIKRFQMIFIKTQGQNIMFL